MIEPNARALYRLQLLPLRVGIAAKGERPPAITGSCPPGYSLPPGSRGRGRPGGCACRAKGAGALLWCAGSGAKSIIPSCRGANPIKHEISSCCERWDASMKIKVGDENLGQRQLARWTV